MKEVYFQDIIGTQDPAFDIGREALSSHIKFNRQNAVDNGVADIFDDESGLKIPDKPIAVVCAARDLTEGHLEEGGLSRIDLLNETLTETDHCVIVAGAGHYAVADGSLAQVDMAITNGSVGNSHTKAFKVPAPDVKYLVASHCFSDAAFEELPEAYKERIDQDEVLVRMDGHTFVGQKTFLYQTIELIQMAHNHPDLISSITVDNPNSINGKIFGTQPNADRKPRVDFEVYDPSSQEWIGVFDSKAGYCHAPKGP